MSVSPQPASSKPAPVARLVQKRGVRQFVKFGIVGASSTVINFAVLDFCLVLLHFKDWHTHGHQTGKYMAATIAFLVSVVNGYVWNKRWTFKGAAEKEGKTQFAQFFLVNLVGLILDLLIIKVISEPLEHEFGVSLVMATNIAQLVATGVVVFWNFFANKKWTFKH